MKKTTITLLCVSFLLAACFSPWRPDEAILTLNLGGGANNRAVAYPPDKETQNNIKHTVQFSGPSGVRNLELEKGVLNVQITVVPGRWDITVQAFLDGDLYAEGSGSVVVVAAQYNPVDIQMRYAGIYYHTVSFDSKGGSDVPDQTVESGGYAHQPDDPTREGYSFVGWYSDEKLTAVYDFSAPVTGDITLYAGWAPVPPGSFTVTFNSNGGSHVSGQVVEAGGTATHPTNPALSGYIFDNWYSDADLTAVYDFSAPVTGNITLYAGWNPILHTVTFNGNGNTGGTVPTAMTANAGASITLPAHETLEKDGCSFDGWNTEADGTGTNHSADSAYTVTADITLYAHWIIIPPGSFSVTFDSNGGSSVETGIVHSGGTATRPANPTRHGYVFVDWYSNSSLTTVYDFSTPITNNITLYARWRVDSGSPGITLTVRQITDGAPIIAAITISRTGSNSHPLTFPVSVTAADFDAGSIAWEIAGVGAYEDIPITGSGAAFTLNAADVRYNALGIHALILTVAKDGVQYQRAIAFTIVQ